LDKLTKETQDEVPWCMLFFDDIVAIDEPRVRLNCKLVQYLHTLESSGFRLTRSKTEYLKCGFSGMEESSEEVTIGGVTIPRDEKFMYLRPIIEEKGNIDDRRY